MFAHAVSIAFILFGVLAVVLYFDPSRVGVSPTQRELYEGKWGWLVAGILFVILGITWLVVSHRRSKRAMWVYQNVKPVDMLATLEIEEDADSTLYYASLRDPEDGQHRWRTWVDPNFRARSLAGSEVRAQVFIDPRSNVPAAIQVEAGVMWANPYEKSRRD